MCSASGAVAVDLKTFFTVVGHPIAGAAADVFEFWLISEATGGWYGGDRESGLGARTIARPAWVAPRNAVSGLQRPSPTSCSPWFPLNAFAGLREVSEHGSGGGAASNDHCAPPAGEMIPANGLPQLPDKGATLAAATDADRR